VREIIEQLADTNEPQYFDTISYLQDMTDKEKTMCLVAFNNALNVGVSTFQYGDRLMEEVIYNHILNKIRLVTTLTPITAFTTIDGNELLIGISPYSLYESMKESSSEIDETQLTTFYRAIIKHELLHVMLKHLLLNPERSNMQIANMVMDALINNMIAEFKHLNVHMITPEDIVQGKFGEGTAFIIASDYALKSRFTWEQYYDYIMKLIEKTGKQLGEYKHQEDSVGKDVQPFNYNTEGDINPKPASELPDDVVDKICDIFKESIERTRGLDRFKHLEELSVDHARNHIMIGGMHLERSLLVTQLLKDITL